MAMMTAGTGMSMRVGGCQWKRKGGRDYYMSPLSPFSFLSTPPFAKRFLFLFVLVRHTSSSTPQARSRMLFVRRSPQLQTEKVEAASTKRTHRFLPIPHHTTLSLRCSIPSPSALHDAATSTRIRTDTDMLPSHRSLPTCSDCSSGSSPPAHQSYSGSKGKYHRHLATFPNYDDWIWSAASKLIPYPPPA